MSTWPLLQLYVVYEDKNGCQIYEYYKASPSEDAVLYNSLGTFESPNTTPIWMRRRDLMGRTLEAGYVQRQDPFIDLKVYVDVVNGKLTGLFGDVLGILSKTMNFSVEVAEPFRAFGIGLQNGTIDRGILRAIADEQLDIAVSPISVTLDRAPAVDFTFPVHRQLIT